MLCRLLAKQGRNAGGLASHLAELDQAVEDVFPVESPEAGNDFGAQCPDRTGDFRRESERRGKND